MKIMHAKLFHRIVIAIILSISWVTLADAHEFETGHIERSIDVIVRGQDVEIKYSLGLADETIVDWLVRAEKLDDADEARFRKSIAELESVSSSETSSLTQASDELTGPTEAPVEGEPDTSGVQDSEFAAPLEFQTELVSLLCDRLSGAVCENLQIASNGRPITFDETTVSNSSRHHVAMQITFRATLSTTKATELSITDRNFLEILKPQVEEESDRPVGQAVVGRDSQKPAFRYFGNIRLACRVKGKAVQLNSNVAPVLTRAKPVELGGLSLEKRLDAATIRTKIAFVRSP
ncbi:hypothetical protein MFFC18_29070 [Mariniblastus fucicola]|uniref:Uncharacterized protein n=2 Tax=Mariniblastus fucicola TaxID=980251 RepID=A0A5B9PCX1_9BACT|nr:hypothetical protein MFFC18_29070 [Mariniblastus fucicola]